MLYRLYYSTLFCAITRRHNSCDGLSGFGDLCACRCHTDPEIRKDPHGQVSSG